jgi:predicted DNA-binding protein (UPF0251 family)
LRELEEVVLALDELEALRLADREGQYHQAAARRMKVSRATFGRILETARHKVADALLRGKALRIDGGPVQRDPGGATDQSPGAATAPPRRCCEGWGRPTPVGASRSGRRPNPDARKGKPA